MKKLTLLVLMTFAFGIVQAQTFDFSKIVLSQSNKDDMAGWMAAGSGGMMWTTASAPSTFGFRVGVFANAGKTPELPAQADVPSYFVNSAGVFVAVGTMGFEGIFRILPVEQVNSMGFGLKYEFTNLIPLPPGIPVSLAGYFDYSKFGYKEKDNDFSSTNSSFGVIASGDLILIKAYGRLGYEMGTAEFKYTYKSGTILGDIPIAGEGESNGIRAAAGLSLGLFDVEVGTRNGLYFGLGASIGF